jgi:hypothetical protein
MNLKFLILFGFTIGCNSKWIVEDLDGDGFGPLDGDCWDSMSDPIPPEGALDYGITASDIYEGAEDLPYDGIDANCDGLNDFDADGDGFTATAYQGIQTLGIEGSEFMEGGDCWDSPDQTPNIQEGLIYTELIGSDIHPGAVETFYDGIDQDCGFDDDFDADGDGFVLEEYEGFITQGITAGNLPGGDCWDLNTEEYPNPSGEFTPFDVNPDAEEIWYDGTDQNCNDDNDCDQDGDGSISNEGYCEQLVIEQSIDCNDLNENVFPNDTPEIYYNGIDDNCDWLSADGDKDGDGYWDAHYPYTEEEVDPSIRYPTALDDCWDDSSSIPTGFDTINSFPQLVASDVFPSAVDVAYDGVNQDCGSDEFEFDQDGDTFNTEHYSQRDGSLGDDCIDSIDDSGFVDIGISPADIYPNNLTDDWYDGIDQDCQGNSDYDSDQDGQDSDLYGGSDCDDTDDNIFNDPSGNNTDEMIDDGMDANCDGQELCYIDFDEDGYGNSAGNTSLSPSMSCSEVGFSSNNSDCDDDENTIYPNATELCDGLINLCGGSLPTDEVDNDGDGYVECSIDSNGWDGDSSVINGGDCDDSDPSLYPNIIWYADTDNDGYGDPTATTTACTQPSGYIEESTDCNDTDNTVYPANPSELCDGQANDCAGGLNQYESDSDGDGYVECSIDSGGWDGDSAVVGGDDCEPEDSLVYPNAIEIVADNIDQNCDGIERCYIDSDNDLYGSTIEGDSYTTSCFVGGFSDNSTDCDDSDIYTFPGAAEEEDITACMTDSDGDGWGAEIVLNTDIDIGTDCDDGDSTIYPTASEISSDGIDQDCDGVDITNTSVSSLVADDLIISELLKKGDHGGEGEWFEIYNNTNDVINLDGLMVSDAGNQSFVVNQTVLLDPGDYAVFANQSDPSLNGNLPVVDYDYADNFRLDDGSDEIILASSTTIIDELYYSDNGNFDDTHRYTIIFDLQVSGADNDDQYYWCSAYDQNYSNSSHTYYGSPGLANDDCDIDGDGYIGADDCNDDDENTYVGAAEHDSTVTCMTDSDGDGYGDDNPITGVTAGSDCSDSDNDTYPFAQETSSSWDYNCDGMEALGYTNCEGEMYSYGSIDKYFLYCNTQVGWAAGNQACIDGGYDGLASVLSSSQNSDLLAMSGNNTWIGLTDDFFEGAWEWEDGSVFSYNNWANNEPNNTGNEDCVEMYNNGKWNDKQCNHSRRFFCSYTY